MVITLRSHVFHEVYVSLIHDLELTTLRRMLGVVATQETRIIANLLKNGNTLVPHDVMRLYCMQYVRILSDEHMLLSSNVALFVMYAQVFNEVFNLIQTVQSSGTRITLKHYAINIFEEMCSRFLDDRLCEDQNKFCRGKNRGTCYALSGFCTLRVLLGLVNCNIIMPNNTITSLGSEVFNCIQRYMEIVCTEALKEDPYSAGFTTPTKLMMDTKRQESNNVMKNLLTPFEVTSQRNLSPRSTDAQHLGLCLNDDMQMLLKFVIHAIMQIRTAERDQNPFDDCCAIFKSFVRYACSLKLSAPCQEVLWGRIHNICFSEYEEDDVNEDMVDIESLVAKQKGAGSSKKCLL